MFIVLEVALGLSADSQLRIEGSEVVNGHGEQKCFILLKFACIYMIAVARKGPLEGLNSPVF